MNNYVWSSLAFVAGLITFIICLPMFDHVIGLMPFNSMTLIFVSTLVLVLVLCIVFVYVRSNFYSFQGQGGEYR